MCVNTAQNARQSSSHSHLCPDMLRLKVETPRLHWTSVSGEAHSFTLPNPNPNPNAGTLLFTFNLNRTLHSLLHLLQVEYHPDWHPILPVARAVSDISE